MTTSAGRFPGVLVEWRRQGDSWKGLVVWAQVAVPIVQQAWLDAKQISRVE